MLCGWLFPGWFEDGPQTADSQSKVGQRVANLIRAEYAPPGAGVNPTTSPRTLETTERVSL